MTSIVKTTHAGAIRPGVLACLVSALATSFIVFSAPALSGTPSAGSEDPWTVLTMAPDGSWGTATDSTSSHAIARAIAECKTMSGAPIGCGAKFTAIRGGWSLGLRCGSDNILVAAQTLVEAERSAVQRETELRARYVPDLPRCQRVVTVDPDGTAETSALRTTGRILGAAAALPIWKTVTIGAHRGVNGYRNALEAAGMKIGDSADEILGRPVFFYEPVRKGIDLVVLSVAELGVEADSASLSEIYRRAAQLGLERCPAEVALQLRLDYADQKLGDFLNIAMEPIKTYGGELTTLTLANGGAGLLLIGRDGASDFMAPRSWRFVFALPRLEHAAQRRGTEIK